MIRDWLSHVYWRLGTTPALDLAMRSVACMQSGLRTKDTRLVNVGRGYYVGALQNLRYALMAPGTSQSELQSTVMLLTFYEVKDVLHSKLSELTVLPAYVESKRGRVGTPFGRLGRDDADTRPKSICKPEKFRLFHVCGVQILYRMGSKLPWDTVQLLTRPGHGGFLQAKGLLLGF